MRPELLVKNRFYEWLRLRTGRRVWTRVCDSGLYILAPWASWAEEDEPWQPAVRWGRVMIDPMPAEIAVGRGWR